MSEGGVFRRTVDNYMSPASVGYIVIPDDEDRDRYIQTCFRKERVDIYIKDGTVVKGCYISKNILQDIYFPQTGELGSAVAFIVPSFFDIPIIVASLSKEDETQLLEENMFKRSVNFQDNMVSIIGKGKTGELFINVESEYEDEGNIFITLRNKNKTSKFNLDCFGDINIYSEGETTLKTLNSIDLKVVTIEDNKEVTTGELFLKDDVFKLTDKKGNKIESDTDGNISIIPIDKCNLFSGSSPLVKGDELKSQLEIMKTRIDKILDALDAGSLASSSIQTYVAAVKGVLVGITDTEDFGSINSDKSFTD